MERLLNTESQKLGINRVKTSSVIAELVNQSGLLNQQKPQRKRKRKKLEFRGPQFPFEI